MNHLRLGDANSIGSIRREKANYSSNPREEPSKVPPTSSCQGFVQQRKDTARGPLTVLNVDQSIGDLAHGNY